MQIRSSDGLSRRLGRYGAWVSAVGLSLTALLALTDMQLALLGSAFLLGWSQLPGV
jgi:hypothetical protein